MEELVGKHPDGIQEAVSLQVFIDLWFGEGRIGRGGSPETAWKTCPDHSDLWINLSAESP